MSVGLMIILELILSLAFVATAALRRVKNKWDAWLSFLTGMLLIAMIGVYVFTYISTDSHPGNPQALLGHYGGFWLLVLWIVVVAGLFIFVYSRSNPNPYTSEERQQLRFLEKLNEAQEEREEEELRHRLREKGIPYE